ncbi:hypothetical protein [Streptomyces sp. WAC06614]|uniref:hypothetical protein n=1 Tax=Streptomyces sp. WAC06614 TaxID=2487416 RepID=UPI000F7A7905|nr:hypothetical protein [Streptomyces sp. WAC06614]RSS54715.1 hypothetical protein EF918_34695 [Streptomyces sp. WAC06614]
MSDDVLRTSSDLKRSFGGYDEMAELVASLGRHVDTINGHHTSSVGGDPLSVTYLGQIREPTQGLAELVEVIRKTLRLTGHKGTAVSDTFTAGEDDALAEAQNW